MKVELTLEPPSGFERETSGFGIQRLNHKGIKDIKKPKYFGALPPEN